jgi:hypothetical protein
MKKFLNILLLCLTMCISGCLTITSNYRVGSSEEDLLKIYSRSLERTYRSDGAMKWITFNSLIKGANTGFITFYLEDDKVINWKENDRKEVVLEYLSEFFPAALIKDCPNIYLAIKDVLERIPEEVFLQVTDRSCPAVFMEYSCGGTGWLANSGEFWFDPDEPQAFSKGFYVIKFNTKLNEVKHYSYIEAIFAHELAHHFLDQGRSSYNIEMERQANRLIKKWGFAEEFEKAKSLFKDPVK